MVVLAILIEIRVPGSRSLKQKRGAVKPILEGLRHRFRLSVAEVDHLDAWQRATVGVAIVSRDVATAEGLADDVERFVWSRPDIEVLEIVREFHEQA